MTPYNLNNLVAGKIRHMLQENPDAGYEELEDMFGNVTRSIRVTYYRIYKELFGKSGSLRRESRKPAPLRDKVTAYFEKHPNSTVQDAATALSLERNSVYGVVYTKNIPFQKSCRGISETSLAQQIITYFKKHPTASASECAQNLNTKSTYVSLITYRARRDGVLPRRI